MVVLLASLQSTADIEDRGQGKNGKKKDYSIIQKGHGELWLVN